MLTFVAAAAVAASTVSPPPQDGRNLIAQVRANATVTILRAERASAVAEPGGLVRHVSRREGAAPTIIFE